MAAGSDLWAADSATVRLAGAANEVLAFQLVVERRAGAVRSIRVEGDRIEASLSQNVAVPVNDKLFDDALVPLTLGDCGLDVAAAVRQSPKLADRKRTTFTVELYIPKGTPAGGRKLALLVNTGGREQQINVELTVYGFELPDEATCNADINNYSRSAASGYDVADDDFDGYLALERAHFQMARQHRALFHLLPYGQSGRQEKDFAPPLTGRGRNRHVADWAAFDKHWGPYLDGSAFAGCRGGARPVEYLYTPVNSNWPAYFENFGTEGYWFEYQQVIREMTAHFAERGWTKTKLEVFFNHKTRWKYYPWDMDEIRFERDNYATIDYGRKALEAAREFPAVQIVNRIDSSWVFGKSAYTEMQDLIGLWVVNRGSHSEAPDAVANLRSRGQKVWFYGGAGPIAAADRVENLRWPWIAWGRETDGFCWWNGLGWGGWDNVGPGTNHCLYPGKRFGVNGPLASLRLKVLLRGMQDHAYLTLLTKKAGRPAVDAIVGRTVGAASREDWYQRHEKVEAGGADIITTSATAKPWNTAKGDAFAAARRLVAEAIVKG